MSSTVTGLQGLKEDLGFNTTTTSLQLSELFSVKVGLCYYNELLCITVDVSHLPKFIMEKTPKSVQNVTCVLCCTL
jgi:hypothetical protein